MRKRLHILPVLLIALLTAVAVDGAAYAQQADDKRLTFFRIGTGPTAETLYSLGTAISGGISRPPGSNPCDQGGICGVPGLIAVAQSKGGSIENLEALRKNDLESALVHADMAYWAYHAKGPFKHETPFPGLRVIANLTPVSMHIVVRDDSDIKTIADLKDRKVSLGPSGSGTVSNALLVLRTYGITLDALRPRFLNPGPATDQLATGEIDALFEVGGTPIAAIQALSERMNIRLLPIKPEAAEEVQRLYPFLKAGMISEGAYNKTSETRTLSLGVQWVTQSKVSSQLVESITRALWQGTSKELYLLDNPQGQFPDIHEAGQETSVPMHAGAKVYYDQRLTN